MSQERLINLECTICHNLNYAMNKSKGLSNPGVKKRLELQKFCKFCKKKTLHKETK